jgi:hypothetical protein
MSNAETDGFRESPVSGKEEAANHEVETTLTLVTIDGGGEAESEEGAAESDPFEGNAEDHAAEETRRKIELFNWADSVLDLGEAELELALDDAVKRFRMPRGALKRIIAARRSERAKAEAKAERNRAEPNNDDEINVKHYPPDYKVSDRGVYARKFDDQGHPFWERICTTRIDLLALTRDRREENWGTYILITNRDGGKKRLAVPHALIAADKVADIAGLLASLGVGVIPSKQARQFPKSAGIPAAILGYLSCRTKPSCLLDSLVRNPFSKQPASMSSTDSMYLARLNNGSIRLQLLWLETAMCICASAQPSRDPYSNGRVNRPGCSTSGARPR